MDIITIIFTGIGLAMDASAVSLSQGMSTPKEKLIKRALAYALSFGFFQAMMPLIGYIAGNTFAHKIQQIDHWIAFILLVLIGANMFKEDLEDKEETNSPFSLMTLLVLSIATSIDALAIGVSFAFLKVDILQASLIIGTVTFILSFICVCLGKKVGSIFQNYAERLGGCILIFLGCKILIEHLFL